jgi:hypothetical protein
VFPFDRPKNYNEMLNKIGISTFLLSLALTWVVARYVPKIGALLSSSGTEVEVLTMHVKILYVVPAIVIAVLARIIRLHNCVSTIFGIRARFDLYKILIPLSGAAGLAVNHDFRELLRLHRIRAMQKTFYVYAGFEEPKISKDIVLAAIEMWTWYWILLEFLVLLLIASGFLFAAAVYLPASLMILTLLVGTFIFLTHYEVCGRKADEQVDLIVSDASWSSAIRVELEKLAGTHHNV